MFMLWNSPSSIRAGFCLHVSFLHPKNTWGKVAFCLGSDLTLSAHSPDGHCRFRDHSWQCSWKADHAMRFHPRPKQTKRNTVSKCRTCRFPKKNGICLFLWNGHRWSLQVSSSGYDSPGVQIKDLAVLAVPQDDHLWAFDQTNLTVIWDGQPRITTSDFNNYLYIDR